MVLPQYMEDRLAQCPLCPLGNLESGLNLRLWGMMVTPCQPPRSCTDPCSPAAIRAPQSLPWKSAQALLLQALLQVRIP